MHDSLISVVMVFILLASGYCSGKLFNSGVKSFFISQITNIVLLLLVCMGVDFGDVFTNRDIGYGVIQNSILFSATLTLITFFLLYSKRKNTVIKKESQPFLKPFKGCVKAFAAFLTGVIIFKFTGFKLESINFSSSFILYVLIYMVGMDLVGFKVRRFTRDLITVPVLTIMATLIAVFIFTIFSDLSWQELLVAASGFGWFSLSGPMVNKLVSPEMGAMAFMTDFFREMFSIIFLYFFGQKQPRGAIGISGAAALDSALPFIKENCEDTFISHAIVSGFVLTILAPFLISFSVTLL